MPTNTQNPTPAGQSPVLALPTGSLLSWGPRNGDRDSLRGYLTNHPETTLFIIEACPFEEEVTMSGALIPDDEEPEKWLLGNAKAAAEQYLRDWLLNVAAPLLANVKVRDAASDPRPPATSRE